MQYFDTFSKLRIQSPCLFTYGVFFVNLYITQHCALWKMCNRINTIQECVSLQEDYAGYRQSRSNQWIEFSFHPNILLKLEPSGGGLYQTRPLLEALFRYFIFLACRSETSLFASEREALTASEPQV